MDDVIPPQWDAIKFYDDVVKSAVKHRNTSIFHGCCNSYSTRGARKAVLKGHTSSIPFSQLFSDTDSGTEKYYQVNAFWKNHLQIWGAFPLKNQPHFKRGTDLTDDDEPVPAAKGKKKPKKPQQLSVMSEEDSRYEKSIADEEVKRVEFEDRMLRRFADMATQLIRFKVQVDVSSSKNKELEEENKRLSDELAQVKLNMAEQKKAIDDITSKLEGLLKATLGSDLGKREPVADSSLVEQNHHVVKENHVRTESTQGFK